jgi:DcuC family C4-dicarboxylate transporter
MLTFLTAAAILLVGAYFAYRKVDIRIVLAAASVGLFALAGQLEQFFVIAAKEMSNAKTVVPICSAMGFAYVVRLTECDTHLIRLLTAPLRRVSALLVPGGAGVGWLVNTAIVSQSSTAATVGPVLIPLVRASGISLATAGSLLLLGASMGGELCNPGAVEIVTLASLLELKPPETVAKVLPANLVASVTALAVFWFLAVRYERRHRAAQLESAAAADTTPAEREPPPINPAKALVPVVPLLLLFTVPRYVVFPAEFDSSIQIGAAMFVGTAVAGLLAPKAAGELARSFFEGAGYAYTHVISLIVTATVFTEGIKAIGLIEALAALLSHQPFVAMFAAVALPFSLAVVGGSGIAPAVAVMKVLVPLAPGMGLDPVRVGAACAVAAQLGRTMSPAAAVVMMSAAVSGIPRNDLILRVAVPLLCGAAAMLVATLVGIV